ncbi:MULTISPECIES: response regulator transcription factor [Streptomyces]|uniref:response regulator transcription factor n=1 Tax=Streptomyces TaxID=1883 RepID=UPI000BD6BC35|nr:MULTISPECIES: response regulator transcription factor [Streptomyces]MCX4610017.1 response regulator transcription factor [Streptomyces mirabilis]MCX5350254.1 response regulator transcription factor [Streptomyces mirabilis]QDN88653.1 response regulator transcription factor [Streptomyces sp. RLB3-6]QDO09494.1 response regulator transcription factor [Streptomyces sp. S1D4-23]SOE28760.1 two-component system, OmpR family, response regulator MprA [Streptomyces sp. OK228]
MARKILLADDDEAVREGLDRLLRFEGYETVLTGDGREALELVAGVDERPDLVLMDVTMPGLDGLAATRRIRASGSTVPILMITGRDAVGDRIVALDNGADDYLMKPFAAEELLARVRALLRRSPRPKQCAPRLDDRLAFADLAMDRPTRTVTRCDRPLDLTRTEYALLEYLLRHPAKVLSRAQILKEVWGFDFEPTSNTLDVYVMYLRRKLESRGEPRLIQTVRGLGYTLRAAK